MSKEKTVKKAEKKKPEKNLKEKRADKKAKKDGKKDFWSHSILLDNVWNKSPWQISLSRAFLLLSQYCRGPGEHNLCPFKSRRHPEYLTFWKCSEKVMTKRWASFRGRRNLKRSYLCSNLSFPEPWEMPRIPIIIGIRGISSSTIRRLNYREISVSPQKPKSKISPKPSSPFQKSLPQ